MAVEPSPQGSNRCALRRFGRSRQGLAAVEFGLIAVPFLALLFAVLETALIFFTNQVLETSVADAARSIYTGTFQQDSANSNKTPAQLVLAFKNKVCAPLGSLFDCPNKLRVDVKSYSAFPNGLPMPITTDSNGNRQIDPAFGQYQSSPPLGPNQIVVVRALLTFPVIVSLLGSDPSNLGPRTRVLMATAAFQTEPY